MHLILHGIFQSTCPLRGTTIERSSVSDEEKISIHVPLAGHDCRYRYRYINIFDFNPRAPCGARHQHKSRCGCTFLFQSTCPLRGTTINGDIDQYDDMIFQSTCPLRGTTQEFLMPPQRLDISIHVPLAGHDKITSAGGLRSLDFNPRAPCGARRRLVTAATRKSTNFNPRAPCGARHILFCDLRRQA